MSEHENPPAFPIAAFYFHDGCGISEGHNGMTLRDYFAGQAPIPPSTWWGGGSVDCAGYAIWNYQYADAMLAARAEPTP